MTSSNVTTMGEKKMKNNDLLTTPTQKVKREHYQKPLCACYFNLNEPHLQMWPPHFHSPQRSHISVADFSNISACCLSHSGALEHD